MTQVKAEVFKYANDQAYSDECLEYTYSFSIYVRPNNRCKWRLVTETHRMNTLKEVVMDDGYILCGESEGGNVVAIDIDEIVYNHPYELMGDRFTRI